MKLTMNCEEPLVSIITITRNRAKIISRSIESILNQSYSNFEHIIVDGASTDNTVEVVKAYKDKRIKLIQLNENIPIPKTIQIGFEESRGKYITFLDDDDEYLPTKIEKQLNLIKKLSHDYGFVYCWMDYYDNSNHKHISSFQPKFRGNVSELIVERPNLSGTPTFFFRRNVYKQFGGWKEGIGIISDWELAVRVCQQYKVDFVPEALVKVFIDDNINRMSNKNYYKNFYSNLIIFHKYFLSEFANIFEKFPSKKAEHYYNISYSYFCNMDLSKAFNYYFKLLKVKFNFRHLVLPFNIIFKKITGKC